jgi:hypothetical protein
MGRFSLININDHPTNRNMKVFFFRQEDHANYFELMLIESKIKYEKQVDEEGDQTIYFGVKKKDYKTVQRLNYLTIGQFRKPFIPDKILRIFVIALSVLVLALAFIGAWISSN